MLDEGTSDFVKQAYGEADQMDVDRIAGNEEIQRILQTPDDAIATVNIGSVKIRIRSFMTKTLRGKLQMIERLSKSEEITFDAVETVLYDALASMCIDEPYNNPITWKIFDDNDKDVNGYLKIMMNKVTEVSQKAKNFRGEPGRSAIDGGV